MSVHGVGLADIEVGWKRLATLLFFYPIILSAVLAQAPAEDRFLRFDIGETEEGDIFYQEFDGTYSFDLGASLASAKSFQQATLLIRFRTTEKRPFMTLFSCSGTQTNKPASAVTLGINERGQIIYRGRNLSEQEFSATAGFGFNDGVWHTAVLSTGAKGTRLYVDGQAHAQIPHTDFLNFLEAPTEMRIGVSRFAAEPRERWLFVGGVDLVEILDQELDADTVREASDQTKTLAYQKAYTIPMKELTGRISPLVVDREPGVALGPVSSALFPDGQTVVALYSGPEGQTFWRRSDNLGRRWGPRQAGPQTEPGAVPSLKQVGDRLLMMHGVPRQPGGIRTSWLTAQADANWRTGGTWAGPTGPASLDVGSSLLPAESGSSRRMLFHDGEGRALASTLSFENGRENWSLPERFLPVSGKLLGAPVAIPSPDGKRLALIQPSLDGKGPSYVSFSGNGGQTFTAPIELPATLHGDKHIAVNDPQSKRLLIVFRDRTPLPFTRDRGDWVAWVGSFDDLLRGRKGKYRVRLMNDWDQFGIGRSGVVVNDDKRSKDRGTFVVTGSGRWALGEEPYIISFRFKLSDLDRLPNAK